MHPSKLIVVKGRTVETKGKWEKKEYTLEITLSEGDDIELAKQYAQTLLESWLR